MAELVSKRYALALFDAGRDTKKIDLFKEELDFLSNILKEQEQLMTLLSHPRINKVEKKELLDKIFKEKFSSELLNFLYILIDKRREVNILGIIEEYNKLFNDYKNIVNVVAKTAVPMEEKAKDHLSKVLGENLNKKIYLTNIIDNSIIGGVILKIENKLIDGSLKGQLESMGRSLMGVTN